MLSVILATLVVATPPLDSPELRAKKRAYLQAQLDAARAKENDTRLEGAALVASSVALPVASIAAGVGAVALGSALGAPEAGLVGGGIILGTAGVTSCLLAPYSLVVGLTRIGEVEEAEREVDAREKLLTQHEARGVRF